MKWPWSRPTPEADRALDALQEVNKLAKAAEHGEGVDRRRLNEVRRQLEQMPSYEDLYGKKRRAAWN